MQFACMKMKGYYPPLVSESDLWDRMRGTFALSSSHLPLEAQQMVGDLGTTKVTGYLAACGRYDTGRAGCACLPACLHKIRKALDSCRRSCCSCYSCCCSKMLFLLNRFWSCVLRVKPCLFFFLVSYDLMFLISRLGTIVIGRLQTRAVREAVDVGSTPVIAQPARWSGRRL